MSGLVRQPLASISSRLLIYGQLNPPTGRSWTVDHYTIGNAQGSITPRILTRNLEHPQGIRAEDQFRRRILCAFLGKNDRRLIAR